MILIIIWARWSGWTMFDLWWCSRDSEWLQRCVCLSVCMYVRLSWWIAHQTCFRLIAMVPFRRYIMNIHEQTAAIGMHVCKWNYTCRITWCIVWSNLMTRLRVVCQQFRLVVCSNYCLLIVLLHVCRPPITNRWAFRVMLFLSYRVCIIFNDSASV